MMNEKNFKVSIITVCYNSVETIEQTIQSVINQTYNNIEYIIIDGASTDGTMDIIERYRQDIAYFVSEPDEGLYYAMNKGIDIASGDVIGIINSDDWYMHDAVEKVVQRFIIDQADIVHGDVERISEWGNFRKSPEYENEDNLYFRMIYNHPTVFVKKNIYREYGKFDCRYRIAADYELLLRFYRYHLSFSYEPSILVAFRVDGLSETKRWKCVSEVRKAALENLNQCQMDKDKYKLLIEQKYVEGSQWALGNFFYQRMKKILSREYVKESFEYFLPEGKTYSIFGTGSDGLECYKWMTESQIPINCFFDNSVKKQGQTLGGIVIHSPDAIKNGLNTKIIIAASNYRGEIIKQLEKIGLRHEEEYIDFSEVQQKALGSYIKDNLPSIYNMSQWKMQRCFHKELLHNKIKEN